MLLLCCKQFHASLDGFVRQEMLLYCWKQFMWVWTNLCNRKCSNGAENDFMRVLMGLCNRKCSYAARNNFMRVWTNLCNRKCSNAARNHFMRLCTDLCNRICSCAAGNNFMRVWTNLCYREWFCETNFHYEISRQKFEQKCAEPFCVVMTHHTAKANLGKGSSWPSEAKIWWGRHTTVLPGPHPVRPTHKWRPRWPHSRASHFPSDYKK